MGFKEKCFECERPAVYNHHVVPKSLGGLATLPLCEFCHSKVHENKGLTDVRFIAKKKREMGIAFGNVPFGYAIENGKKIRNENEQKIISIIASLYNLNHHCKGIAEILNKRGHKTKKYVKWYGGAVANILRKEGFYNEDRPVVTKSPYGYGFLCGKKVPIEEEQNVIDKMVSLKKRGFTDIRICKYLKDQGYKKRGGEWGVGIVRSLLKRCGANRNGPSGFSPYGYAYGFDGMIPVEAEQEIIKTTCSLSMQCLPNWKIARELNELGYRTRRKNKWGVPSVCRVISENEETKVKRISITINKRLWKEFHVKADIEKVSVRDLIEKLVKDYVDSDESPNIPLEIRRKLGLGRKALELH